MLNKLSSPAKKLQFRQVYLLVVPMSDKHKIRMCSENLVEVYSTVSFAGNIEIPLIPCINMILWQISLQITEEEIFVQTAAYFAASLQPHDRCSSRFTPSNPNPRLC